MLYREKSRKDGIERGHHGRIEVPTTVALDQLSGARREIRRFVGAFGGDRIVCVKHPETRLLGVTSGSAKVRLSLETQGFTRFL